jgi:hypothetical protein
MKERVQLVLKSCDINQLNPTNKGYQTIASSQPFERANDYIGTNGSINLRQSSMTWNNINLRSILGELYENNCDYTLELVNITFFLTSNLNTYSNNESDRTFNVYMGGLPNMQSYSSLGATQDFLLTSMRLPTGIFCNSYNYNNNQYSFKTNTNQTVDLTITLRNLLNNAIQPVSNSINCAYPYGQYTFNIFKSI